MIKFNTIKIDKQLHFSLLSYVNISGILVIPELTIYALMIYTAPNIMVLMRAYPLQGQVGGGWAPGNQEFLGPVKWHRAIWRVPFQAQEILDFQCTTPSHLP